MNILQSIILGIVEGVTEFLPISSTFHLIYTAKLLSIPQNDFTKLFEVFIQSGAILSVFILYVKELWNDRELLKKVIVSFIPTALIGFGLYKVIKDVFFESDAVMIGAFFIVGIFFLLIEHSLKTDNVNLDKQVKSLGFREAVLIGLAQSMAIIPGVSRAGSVIIAMIFLGYKRSDAAKYSFMLSIPTIFAASAYDLFKMRDVLVQNTQNITLLAVGFISAFVTSYFVVKWLIQYLKNHSLVLFGWYRVLIVISVLLGLYITFLIK